MRDASGCQVLSAKVKTGREFGFPPMESGRGLGISSSDPLRASGHQRGSRVRPTGKHPYLKLDFYIEKTKHVHMVYTI